jgi:GntR family transcriptional regulator
LAVIIDLRSRTPIYEQIIQSIKEQALSGELKPDEQIPSIRQLTHELGINPNTIHKAYAELERQGVIYSLAGRGAFISDAEEVRKLAEAKRGELMLSIAKSVAGAKKLDVSKPEMESELEKIVNKIYDEGGGGTV